MTEGEIPGELEDGPGTGSGTSGEPAAEGGRAAGWTRYLPYAVYGVFALRVIVVLVLARHWFFTDDDWDYITRDRWSQILQPHSGHLNVVAAVWAYVARGIVGIDYWPGYALFAALAWPLVGLVAWHVWRRMGTDPRWAALGAAVLIWLGTSSWIQFGHAGQGVAAAALIAAVYLDTKPVGPAATSANVALSVLAALSSSTAGLAVILRGGLGLVYRRWNAVIAGGAAAAVYLGVRVLFASIGPGTFRVGLRGLTDVWETTRVALSVLGIGGRDMVLWPAGIAWLLGLLILAAAGLVLWKARLSYFATALVGSGALYFVVGLVTRFLGRANKLEEVLGGTWESLTAARFTNLTVALTLVAAIPLLAAARYRRPWVPAAVAGLLVAVIGFGVVRSADRWDEIAAKSADPKASWVVPIVELRAAGEPGYPSSERKTSVHLSNYFDLDAVDYVIEAGLVDSLLASDIYRTGAVPEIAESKARGVLRMNVRPGKKTLGGWADLGEAREPGCVLVEGSAAFDVLEDTRFRLERVEGNDVKLRWSDDWGRGGVDVPEQYWRTGDGRVTVDVPGLTALGSTAGRIEIESPAVAMCFD